MNKVLLTLLVLVFALHAGVACGVAQAGTVMEAPCCGNNCPVGSAIGESACCHAQDSTASGQGILGSVFPAIRPLVGPMHASVAGPTPSSLEHTFLFQGGPPGATKLALLCSRQI